MKKLFTLLLFVLVLHSSWAANYYFSAVSGDDSRSATQAKSPSTPWKTLNKLNAVFSTLLPGDSVLLKSGETFYGSIIVKKSGTATSPIVIGSYGSGSKPVITSLVTLSTWTSKGNGIYESFNSALNAKLKIVLLNGVQQELGRYPNSDAANSGYLYFETHSGTTSITDQQLTSSVNWTGADVVIRPRHWVLSRNVITAYSGTTISYKASTSYAPSDKFGYFIENSIKTLDKFGEWYYDSTAHKLSVYFGSNSPSSYKIQIPTKDDIIHSEKFSYVTFTNLSIIGANTSSVNIRYGSNINLKNCDINFSGENGVSIFYHTYFKVEGCTINNSNYGGIYMGYNGSDNATIRNNKISNTSLFPGMAQSGDQAGLGIMSYGNYNVIEYNEIRKTGYNGITFNGHDVTVKNNYIDTFCIVKDDGGGIYAHAGGSTTVLLNRKITGNIILNGLGAPDGAYNAWDVPAEGIYLDEGTANVAVTANTIANCTNQGIYFHNSHDITVSGNTIYTANNRYMSMLQSANKPLIRNNTVNSNIFFSNAGAQTLLYLASNTTDQLQFAKFSGNYYARPADNNTSTILNKIRVYESTAAIKSYTTAVRFEYNTTQNAKTVVLDASYVDAKNKTYSGSITLQPFTSLVLIRTGSVTNVAPTVSITSPVANASFAAPASVTISANAADVDGKISKVQFYNGTTLLGTDTTSPYSFTWNNVAAGNYSITAKATDNSSVTTTSASVAISVYAPNVAPTVSITSPVANASFAAPASVTISANAADVDGKISKVQFYNGTTLLGTDTTSPYSFTWNNVAAGNYSITAKATDNSSVTTTSASVAISVYAPNVAPTVSITSPVANASFAAPASVTISANAADTNGAITKVDFYNGNTLLGTDSTTPYSFTWNNVAAGNYTITAKATDNSSLVTTSAAVTISVSSSNIAPSVSFTGIATNINFGSATSVTMSVVATDTDGTISKVQFYNADTLLGTVTASPYTFTWNDVQPGTYTLTAKATDDKGAVTTSSKITISVVAPIISPRSLNMRSQLTASAANSATLNLKVFPNPAVNQIQVDLEGLQISNQKANLIITSISGSIVKNIPAVLSGRTLQADVSSLSPGSYIVSVVTDGFRISKMFLKN